MNKTSIEWCRTYREDGSFEEGYSVNPVRFRPTGSLRLTTMCQKVSPGCVNCYAESITRRFWPKDAAQPFPGYTAQGVASGEFVLDEKTLLSVLKVKKPARVFWGDMTDLFQASIPDDFLDRCFAICALTPHLTHMFLTKRPERMLKYLSDKEVGNRVQDCVDDVSDDYMFEWPLPNVHLGVSVERQKEADERIPLLLQTPAAVRFISAEPLLGPVNLRELESFYDGSLRPLLRLDAFTGEHECGGQAFGPTWGVLDLVIVGGESGQKARPMHPDWARSLRDQCKAAGVPFFFKQWGEWVPWQEDGGHSEWKSQAGKLMDRHAFPDFNDANERGWTDVRLYDGDSVCVHQRVGKKASGFLLDGVEHHEFPEVRA